MKVPRTTGWVLDRFLNERRWFFLASPSVRRALRPVDWAVMAGSLALAARCIVVLRNGGHPVQFWPLLCVTLAIVVFVSMPLSQFLAIERVRDRACKHYIEFAHEETTESTRWAEVACRHALMFSDRATAIVLYARMHRANLAHAHAAIGRLEDQLLSHSAQEHQLRLNEQVDSS
jgi:hypothetical protein